MDKRICLGKIVAAHGIKGEVKVLPQTSRPLQMDKFGTLENADGSQNFIIKVVGKSGATVRIKIKGTDTRNAAEALVGTELYAQRENMPQLDNEEYYQTDIIGLQVCLQTPEQKIGTVVGFQNYGAGDIIEIKIDGHKETELLPFTKAYVPIINLADGYIIVTSATMVFAADEEE